MGEDSGEPASLFEQHNPDVWRPEELQQQREVLGLLLSRELSSDPAAAAPSAAAAAADSRSRQREATVAATSSANSARSWSVNELTALEHRHSITRKLLEKAKTHSVQRTASAATAMEEELRAVRAELAKARAEKTSLGAAWAMAEATVAEARAEARTVAVADVATEHQALKARVAELESALTAKQTESKRLRWWVGWWASKQEQTAVLLHAAQQRLAALEAATAQYLARPSHHSS